MAVIKQFETTNKTTAKTSGKNKAFYDNNNNNINHHHNYHHGDDNNYHQNEEEEEEEDKENVPEIFSFYISFGITKELSKEELYKMVGTKHGSDETDKSVTATTNNNHDGTTNGTLVNGGHEVVGGGGVGANSIKENLKESISNKKMDSMETITENVATSNGSIVVENGVKNKEEEKVADPSKTDNNNNNKNDEDKSKSELKKSAKILPTSLESDEPIKPPSQFSLGVFLIKFIVIFFDIITFPIYFLIQKPWIKKEKIRKIRAVLENPDDPNSPYIHLPYDYKPNHYIFRAQTIPETQQLTYKLNSKNVPLLGRRRIVDVITETNSKGKKLFKYNLTDYEWIDNEQCDQIIGELARGFLAQGIKFQERVCIYSETRMEWFLCAQALWRIGAIVTTLYTTLGLKAIQMGIEETKVEHVITSKDLLTNLKKIIKDIPNVRKIYVFDVHPGLLKPDPIAEADFNEILKEQNRLIHLISYDDLRKNGYITKDSDFDYQRPKPEDVAVILYTSGSTGNPKGVIYTHANFLATIYSVTMLLTPKLEDQEILVYYGVLPLAHAFELLVEIILYGLGGKIGYGSPITMTDSSTAILAGQKGDLKLLKPSLICGVPLLLDRIRRTITDRFERKKSIFWKQLVKFSVAYKNYWIDRGFDTPLINKFICGPLNGNLGGNVRYIMCGGAPLSAETQRMMNAFLNARILLGYGSTETSGASCVTDLDDLLIGRVGAPTLDVKIRLKDWPEGGYSVHDKPYPRGEIIIGGPHITKGYFEQPEKTAEVYEEKDGTRWFATGDIGEVDQRGTFKVIDRKKDLVKLQFGEYVSLGKVEAELKTFNYVENVCVYGDSMHTYIIALIQPQRQAMKKLAEELGKSDRNFIEWCEDDEINQIILQNLKEFCYENGLHKMETPQKIKLVHEEWSLANGLITTSMKLKRREIEKKYKNIIDELYGKSTSATTKK